MEKTFNKKIIIVFSAAALVSGALVWLAVFRQLGDIKKSSDDIQKEQLDFMVRQQRSQKIFELGKELGDVKKDQEEMKAMFVGKEDAVPFLKILENIAAETGNTIKISVTDLSKIKLRTAKKPVVQEPEAESAKDLQKEEQVPKNIQPQSVKPDFSNQLGFSVEITGNFRSLVDFLTKLENIPYFARVYSFQSALTAKSQAVQSAQGGAAQPVPESKEIKTTLVISVYTDGKK